MIKLVIGGIGSGKTISVVKEVIDRDKVCFTNFAVDSPNVIRLQEDHIIKRTIIKEKKDGTPVYKYEVNWDFWNDFIKENNSFDIYIDEAHSVANARRSISKWNIFFNYWISQIRKILSGNDRNHLYMISQRITGIDSVARELAGEIIYVYKVVYPQLQPTKLPDGSVQMLPKTFIFKVYFTGMFALESLSSYFSGEKSYSAKNYFLANYYYQFYDTFAVVRFGEDVYI